MSKAKKTRHIISNLVAPKGTPPRFNPWRSDVDHGSPQEWFVAPPCWTNYYNNYHAGGTSHYISFLSQSPLISQNGWIEPSTSLADIYPVVLHDMFQYPILISVKPSKITKQSHDKIHWCSYLFKNTKTPYDTQTWQKYWRFSVGNLGNDNGGCCPLVLCYIAIEHGIKWPIEIVALPNFKMVIFIAFHSHVNYDPKWNSWFAELFQMEKDGDFPVRKWVDQWFSTFHSRPSTKVLLHTPLSLKLFEELRIVPPAWA